MDAPIAMGVVRAGWGFESNVTAAAANAASLNVLRANPIFEHDPGGMFTNSIPQTLQNSILAKGIPALSEPLGSTLLQNASQSQGSLNINMDSHEDIPRPNGWCRQHAIYDVRWLHSDLQNVAYYFTHRLFMKLVFLGDL